MTLNEALKAAGLPTKPEHDVVVENKQPTQEPKKEQMVVLGDITPMTLAEARKAAGLPAIKESEGAGAADEIFAKLVKGAATPDNFNEEDEKMIRSDINSKLKKGWTGAEIVGHLKWTEYFDTETDEDTALRKMKETSDKVKARLESSK